MRQSTRPPAAIVCRIAGLAMAVTMVACGGSVTPTPLAPTVPTITALPSLDEMLSEKILGSASAPNTIIEYVSFWSSPSMTFYLTGEGAQMKSQLADTGRAQIQFRNLFLSSETQISGVPVAAMLARCAGNARFFDAVTTIFQRQPVWVAASNPDTAVQQIMLGFGMSQSVVNSCQANSALLNGLVAIHTNAEQGTYQLPDGTQRAGSSSAGVIFNVPAVVVNGVLFDSTNSDGTANAAFAPTLANIQPFLK
jgi:Thioredoxin